MVNFFSKYYIFLVVVVTSLTSFAQTTNTVIKAKIEIEKLEGLIKITGTAENLSDIVQSSSYKLSVIKKNVINNNESNNSQEGFFSLSPSENKNLSTTQVNLGSGDEVIILLLFYNENKQLIGKDRIVLLEEKKNEVVDILSEGFELTGIISDETKTKIGKDFYDLYYNYYNDYKISSNKIITLSEEFTFSRNTKIIITINYEVIYEFIARPDEEYLITMAEQAIYATHLHLKKLEKQDKDFTQY
jgi:hypothetical protein